jgi:hypothetical protein
MRVLSGVGCAAAVLLAAGTVHAAAVYDAAKQFSKVSNTSTSTWSYRFNTTDVRDGNYTLLPNVVVDSKDWTTKRNGKTVKVKASLWESGAFPEVTANQSKQTYTANFGFGVVTWPAHTVYMHPDTTGDDVLSFLAPKRGKLNIAYSFTDIDPYGGNGILWYVDHNAGSSGDLATGMLDSTDTIDTTGVKHLTVSMNKGDRINFIVDSDADISYDSTAVTAVIKYK